MRNPQIVLVIIEAPVLGLRESGRVRLLVRKESGGGNIGTATIWKPLNGSTPYSPFSTVSSMDLAQEKESISVLPGLCGYICHQNLTPCMFHRVVPRVQVLGDLGA